jgi:hypothetical protein
MPADRQLLLEAAPPLKKSVVLTGSRARSARFVLAAIVMLHATAIYLATRSLSLPPARQSEGALSVSIVATPPEPALPVPTPHLNRARPVPPAAMMRVTRSAPVAEPSNHTHSSVQIFNRDGSVALPRVAAPQKSPFDADVVKGRELMSRGLDCDPGDPLSTHESLGEEVARKYLGWIGLYNGYAAERRAELHEERKQRCARWKGQS